MSLCELFRSMDLTDLGIWGIIGVSGGYCAVTMVLVPLLAFLAGGYLTITAQYGIALGLMVIAFGAAVWLYHRRTADEGMTPIAR